MQPDTRILAVEMPDGSIWGIPVMVVARHRAAVYAPKFGDDTERSLAEDTLPLFAGAEGEAEIEDWAIASMDWADIKPHLRKIRDTAPLDDAALEDGWNDGPLIVEAPDAA